MDTDETRMGLLVDHVEQQWPHAEVTEAVIGASFTVHNELGFGFLERVYQRSMQVELVRMGLRCEIERRIEVRYKGVVVGDYVADLVINDCVVVELKVAPDYNKYDEAQLLNELHATGMKVGLLINFGRKVQFKRLVY